MSANPSPGSSPSFWPDPCAPRSSCLALWSGRPQLASRDPPARRCCSGLRTLKLLLVTSAEVGAGGWCTLPARSARSNRARSRAEGAKCLDTHRVAAGSAHSRAPTDWSDTSVQRICSAPDCAFTCRTLRSNTPHTGRESEPGYRAPRIRASDYEYYTICSRGPGSLIILDRALLVSERDSPSVWRPATGGLGGTGCGRSGRPERECRGSPSRSMEIVCRSPRWSRGTG